MNYAIRPPNVRALTHDAWEVCHALLAWLVALNLADIITTRAVLQAGGTESNPLMQPFVGDILHAVALKGSCLLIVTALVLRTRTPDRTALVLGAVNVWYLAVVCWNLLVLSQGPLNKRLGASRPRRREAPPPPVRPRWRRRADDSSGPAKLVTMLNICGTKKSRASWRHGGRRRQSAG